MKQYVILTDASDNSTYGLIVKDGSQQVAHGAHRRAQEWAIWANAQNEKSIDQLLPLGISQSSAKVLPIDSDEFVRGLIEASTSSPSAMIGRRAFVGTTRLNAESTTPAARDFQLSAFDISVRQKAVSFKALAFKFDVRANSFGKLLRGGLVGFNDKTGMIRSRIADVKSFELQARIDAVVPRSVQRSVGLNDIAHKSVIASSIQDELSVKKLGGRIGNRIGRGLRSAPDGFVFIDVTGRVDADKDGIVFEGLPLERPIIPRFMIPEGLAGQLAKLTDGDSLQAERSRRSGMLGADFDANTRNNVAEKIRSIGSGDGSLVDVSSTQRDFGTASQRSIRDAIMRRRTQAPESLTRVGSGEKTQIDTQGSLAVEKLSWDDKAKELIVTFNGGRTYTYKNVDDKWVTELESNPDALGRILNDIKKAGFSFEKGGDHAPDSTLFSRAQVRREAAGMRSSRDEMLPDTVWAGERPGVEDIKSGANLSGADLSGMDLSGVDLSNCDLSLADLSGTNLSGANLSRSHLFSVYASGAKLDNADLESSRLDDGNFYKASLVGANLRKVNANMANFEDADLSKANLNRSNIKSATFYNANMSGADISEANGNALTEFVGANLSDADLSGVQFERSVLRGANLTNANLFNANLREANLKNAIFRNADLNEANLTDAVLDGAILRDANLTDAVLDQGWEQRVGMRSLREGIENTRWRGERPSESELSAELKPGGDLSGADLSGVDFGGADLTRINMSYANLKNANLNNTNLFFATLDYADLKGADLSRARLEGSSLFGVNLRKANLKDARLKNANLTMANLRGADLRDADFTNTRLDYADLRGIKIRANQGRVINLRDQQRPYGLERGRFTSTPSSRSARMIGIDEPLPPPGGGGGGGGGGGNPPDDPDLTPEQLKEIADAPLYELAAMIRRDLRKQGKKVPFGSEPYIDALSSLSTMNDRYLQDDARFVVAYLLSNLKQYRGKRARAIKAELRGRLDKNDKFRRMSTRSMRVAQNSPELLNWSIPDETASDELVQQLIDQVGDASSLRNGYAFIGDRIITPLDVHRYNGTMSSRSITDYDGPNVDGVTLPTWAELRGMRETPVKDAGLNPIKRFVDDATGRAFYVKRGREKDGTDGHAQAEVAGAAVYRVAGARVPYKALIKDENGKTWIVSEEIPGTKGTYNPSDAVRAQARADMGLDMLVQLWDGWSGGSNKRVTPAGDLVTIDTGGAGPYRAQGDPMIRGFEFSPESPWNDVATMVYKREGIIPGQHISGLYGKVTNDDFAKAMRRVEYLDLQELDRQMLDAGVGPEMRKLFIDTIRARQVKAKTLADEFSRFDPSARVNVAGTSITPGGTRSARKSDNVASLFSFVSPRRTRNGSSYVNMSGYTNPNIKWDVPSRQRDRAPRLIKDIKGEVVWRGKTPDGRITAEVIELTDGPDATFYAAVIKEKTSSGTVTFGYNNPRLDVNYGDEYIATGASVDTRASLFEEFEGRHSGPDEAMALIEEYIDTPPGQENYDDIREALDEIRWGIDSANYRSNRSIGRRGSFYGEPDSNNSYNINATPFLSRHNGDVKSARSATLGVENNEPVLVRPSDGFHYADFERMSDRQLLQEYFRSISESWNDLSSGLDSPRFPHEREHAFLAIRDRKLTGAINELQKKYEMDFVAAMRDGRPFEIPREAFDSTGSYARKGKRPSIAASRSMSKGPNDIDAYEAGMTLGELGDLHKDVTSLSGSVGILGRERREAFAALDDAIINAIGGVDSIHLLAEEFEEARAAIEDIGRLARDKRQQRAAGRILNLLDEMANSDGYFTSAALAERGHMFDMPQDDSLRQKISRFAGALRNIRNRSSRSSYVYKRRRSGESEGILRDDEIPDQIILDAYKDTQSYLDNYDLWRRQMRSDLTYRKEQGATSDRQNLDLSRRAYEGSPQFIDDARLWDSREMDPSTYGRNTTRIQGDISNLDPDNPEDYQRYVEAMEGASPLLSLFGESAVNSNRSRRRSQGFSTEEHEAFQSSDDFENAYQVWRSRVQSRNNPSYAISQGIDPRSSSVSRFDFVRSPEYDSEMRAWNARIMRELQSDSPAVPFGGRSNRSQRSNISSESLQRMRDAFQNDPSYNDGIEQFIQNAKNQEFRNLNGLRNGSRISDDDYRYSASFDEDAVRFMLGKTPLGGSSRSSRSDGYITPSPEAGRNLANWRRPSSGNSAPRYSDSEPGGVVALRGKSKVGDAWFEIIDRPDGKFVVRGVERGPDGKYVDIDILDEDAPNNLFSLADREFVTLEDALEGFSEYILGPEDVDEAEYELLDSLDALPRRATSNRSSRRVVSSQRVSERQRIANIERGSMQSQSARSSRKGLALPGHARIDDNDGQLWESLTPEQRKIVESRSMELEDALIRAVSGPGEPVIAINQETGEIIELAFKGAGGKYDTVPGGNEYVRVYGLSPDFNLHGMSAQAQLTGGSKRQQEKLKKIAKYDLVTTQKDPVTGRWHLALTEKGLDAIYKTYPRMRDIYLNKLEAIEASNSTPGIKAANRKRVLEALASLDESVSGLLTLGGARRFSKDGRNDEGGERLSFVPEQLPSGLRKEIVGKPSRYVGMSGEKKKIFDAWATRQTTQKGTRIKKGSKEYAALLERYNNGELDETIWNWYTDQVNSKFPYGEQELTKRGILPPDRIPGFRLEKTERGRRWVRDFTPGDSSVVGSDVDISFEHSAKRAFGQVTPSFDEEQAGGKRKKDSFWARLTYTRTERPEVAGWVQRWNERQAAKQRRLAALKGNKATYGGERESVKVRDKKELKLLKRNKAERLKKISSAPRGLESVMAERQKTLEGRTPIAAVDQDGATTLNPERLDIFGKLKILRDKGVATGGATDKDAKKAKKEHEKVKKSLSNARNIEQNPILGALWDATGSNGRPTVVGEEDFIEAAQQPGAVVIRRGFGGKTFANEYLDDPARYTTGQQGEMQGPGEYWAIRIKDGRRHSEGDGWSWYVSSDNQPRAKGGGLLKGYEDGPGAVVAVLPADAKILKKSELAKIRDDLNRLGAGISTEMRAETYGGSFEVRSLNPDFADAVVGELYRSVPEGDEKWNTPAGQLISQLTNAIKSSKPGSPERKQALDALRFILEGTSGQNIRNFLGIILGYDALEMDSGVMLVINRGSLITFGGVGGKSVTDAVERAVSGGSRIPSDMMDNLKAGRRVD